jgi:hypothetical protein
VNAIRVIALVFTDPSVSGKTDPLRGLNENVTRGG